MPSPLRHLRLRRRMFLLFTAFVVLLGLDLAAAVLVLVNRDREQSVIVDHLNPAREDVADLSTSFVDQETGQRGYIITGQQPFLQPYTRGGAQADRDLALMRVALAKFPKITKELNVAAGAIMQWRARAGEPEIAARRSGHPDVAVQLVSAGPGAALFRDANNQIARLRTGIVRELSRRQANADRERRNLTDVVFVSFGLALGLLAISALAIEQWVHRPIANLTDAVDEVAGGRLYREIPASNVPDFDDLGLDVDAMRLRILQELDDADRARQALAKRGLLVLALRDELARGSDTLPDPLVAAARFEPAEGVLAGDWWDIVRLDDDRAAVAIVDVSGHGAESGVLALRSKQLFVGAMRSGWSPGESLQWIAESLGDTGEQFLTGVVVEVSASRPTWRYANAGHPDLLLCRPGRIDQLPPTGPLLGPLPGQWETHEFDVDDTTLLTAYTDGLIEARNDQLEQFGPDRLLQAVLDVDGRRRPDEVADACLAALRRFTERRSSDDMTLVVVGRQ